MQRLYNLPAAREDEFSMSTISPFAQALLAQREHYNAKFAEARHFRPTLEPATFSAVLREQCAPIADAVAHTQPSALPTVTDALYDIALDLAGQGLLGSGARHPVLNRVWSEVLPALAKHIATQPQRTISAISNGLYNLVQTPGTQAQSWLDGITALGRLDVPLDTLLQAGQVLAWQCGMAHYRDEALALCQQLPGPATRVALSLPPNADVASLLAQLAHNPWFRPDAPHSSTKSLRVVARVGAFRGFGGLFMAPPTVSLTNGQFIVKDGEQQWLLMADAFGATLHRQIEPTSTAKQSASDFKLIKGIVSKSGCSNLTITELETITSVAGDNVTLAVTTPWSHAVTLIAGT